MLPGTPLDPYVNYYYPSAFPERKPLKSGSANAGESAEALQQQMPGQKKLSIIDPNSGSEVNTLGLFFSPPKPCQPLTIIDPSSGSAIKLEKDGTANC